MMLFSYGFRPFFLAAGCAALVLGPLWAWSIAAAAMLPVAELRAADRRSRRALGGGLRVVPLDLRADPERTPGEPAVNCNLNGKVVLVTGAAGGIGAAAAQALYDRGARMAVSFANAGIAWCDAPATVAGCDPAEFERIVAVDLFGVWRTVRASLPEVTRNQGQVLITASIYAFLNGMVNSTYAASRAAVALLGRALRVDLAGNQQLTAIVRDLKRSGS
jgi:hypothetical protein